MWNKILKGLKINCLNCWWLCFCGLGSSGGSICSSIALLNRQQDAELTPTSVTSPRLYCANTTDFRAFKSQHSISKFGHTSFTTNYIAFSGKTKLSEEFALLWICISLNFEWKGKSIFRPKSDENVLDWITE